MTNPAEKIRQVVEGHIEALDGIELYKGGKRTSMCLVSTAKESMLYMAESMINAIIGDLTEEKEKLSADYEQVTKKADRMGLLDSISTLRCIIHRYEEARTSLTTTL